MADCKFPGCIWHAESNGYCIRHRQYAKETGTKVKHKEPPVQTPVFQKPIAKVSAKKAQELKDEKPDRDKLNAWFESIEKKECPGLFTHCWECGAKILKAFIRAAIAHVLPKRKNQFPSVATHEKNYMILGAGCGCHNKYDKSWEDAATMKVWPMAVERFIEIYPSIPAEEKKNIPEELLQELEPVE